MSAATNTTACAHGLGLKCLACYPLQYASGGVLPTGVATILTPRVLNAQPTGADYTIRYGCYARHSGMKTIDRMMKDLDLGKTPLRGYIMFLDDMLGQAIEECPEMFRIGEKGAVLKNPATFTDWLLTRYPNPSSLLLQQRLLDATKEMTDEQHPAL